jgi:hypothetical protein
VGGRLAALNRHALELTLALLNIMSRCPKGEIASQREHSDVSRSTCIRTAQWLKACGIETVVMPATGVYWIALFQILESYGFQINVVNARHTKKRHAAM